MIGMKVVCMEEVSLSNNLSNSLSNSQSNSLSNSSSSSTRYSRIQLASSVPGRFAFYGVFLGNFDHLKIPLKVL